MALEVPNEQASAGYAPDAVDGGSAAPVCCPFYHRAVELIGRRWTGAIIEILMQGGSLRFSQIAGAVTDLSDRMLSDRLKELESHGLVRRTVLPGPPVRVEYALTPKGQELAPTLAALKLWARHWLTAVSFDAGSATQLRAAEGATALSAEPTPPPARASARG
ncbi:MAG: helix-turn-helix domain-containing protein [Solirubrobacteraceae bacterium]|jgi:DNA-binding HxlR family transcriptional regulator